MDEYFKIAVEFFKAISWPSATVLIVYLLRRNLQTLLDRIRLVTLKGYGGEASFTIGEVQDVLQQLVQETVESAKGLDDVEGLVVHHSDFEVLIPSHSRIGKLSGGTRISMLLGTPG